MVKTIVVHACAGAGISIADKACEFIDKMECVKGRADIIFNAIDTSEANFKDTKDGHSPVGLRHTKAIVGSQTLVRHKRFWKAGANNRFALTLQHCERLIQIKQIL